MSACDGEQRWLSHPLIEKVATITDMPGDGDIHDTAILLNRLCARGNRLLLRHNEEYKRLERQTRQDEARQQRAREPRCCAYMSTLPMFIITASRLGRRWREIVRGHTEAPRDATERGTQ